MLTLTQAVPAAVCLHSLTLSESGIHQNVIQQACMLVCLCSRLTVTGTLDL